MTTRYQRFRLAFPSGVTLNANVHAGQSFYLILNVPEVLSGLSVRTDDTPKQGAHGTEDGLSQYGARSIPVLGEIHALTSDARFTMERDLKRDLALPIAQSFDGDDGYFLLLISDQDGTEMQVYAKVLEPPTFELLPDLAERRSKFRFVLYAKDPEIYSQTLQTATSTESFASATFTMQDGDLPTFQDDDLPTFQDVVGVTITVSNGGTHGTPPLIVVYGPTDSPVIENTTTGKIMSLDGLTVLTGERVEIDVGSIPKSITHFDASDVETDASGYLTDDSDWIFIEPGDNVLTVSDDSPGDLAASMEVQWRDTYV